MIVVTGFEPFLSHVTNPSWELAQQLSQSDAEIKAFRLPVSYQKGFETLKNHLSQLPAFPDFLCLLGLAANRKKIGIEVIALNWMESPSPDNEQKVISGEPICPTAPIFFSQNDLPLIRKLVSSEDILISHCAGTYVCNDLYYRTLHCYQNYRNRILFIHVPPFEVIPASRQLSLLRECIQTFKDFSSTNGSASTH